MMKKLIAVTALLGLGAVGLAQWVGRHPGDVNGAMQSGVLMMLGLLSIGASIVLFIVLLARS